jgi:hypothetical protein
MAACSLIVLCSQRDTINGFRIARQFYAYSLEQVPSHNRIGPSFTLEGWPGLSYVWIKRMSTVARAMTVSSKSHLILLMAFDQYCPGTRAPYVTTYRILAPKSFIDKFDVIAVCLFLNTWRTDVVERVVSSCQATSYNDALPSNNQLQLQYVLSYWSMARGSAKTSSTLLR